jgi:exopolysaccharide biosynthesis polyprenyl glycosylphosphotransferase
MRVTGKVPVRYIEDRWLLFSQDFAGISGSEKTSLKRLMDIVIAASALTLLSPLMLLLWVVVKITSRGPVLYRQERVGLDKRPYQLLKFRTMRADAESEGSPRWATNNDHRATPVGRIMRRLRLDEIPQFINVLRGEMSVIGPRPERPYFVDLLERDIPYYALRFAAKPGLTGWAQVNYRYGASVEDAHTKLQYDLYYIQEMSPFLDLVILLKTFQTLIFRPGY